ncbi:MAG: DUF4190 domain-containing protein [Clostridia bacterium]|nr:DUF4190 domain-containing protein [Clostridia bacterium]
MEIASLILGIVSIILSFIPFVGILCYLPAIVGIILGIVALATMKSRGKNKKGMPITGIILSGVSMILAIVMLIVWTVVGIGSYEKNMTNNSIYNSIYNNIYNSVENKISNSIINDYDYDHDDDDELAGIREYRVGQEIQLDYYKVVIDKIEDFSGNSNLKAGTGKELVMVTVTVTNTDDSSTYVSKYDFEINDGVNYSDPEYDSTHKYATFESKSLGVGESMTGTLCFQKEKNNDHYYIVCDGEGKVKLN